MHALICQHSWLKTLIRVLSEVSATEEHASKMSQVGWNLHVHLETRMSSANSGTIKLL
jgi:hypothetical protein